MSEWWRRLRDTIAKRFIAIWIGRSAMPARLVDDKYRAGKLYSGSKNGPVVTNPKQMKAIQLSEARDDGHDIPPPKRGKRPARRKR